MILLNLVAGVNLRAQVGLLKQTRNGAATSQMTASEIAQLGDPLFRLVLNRSPQPTQLDAIESLLVGGQGTRHLFVVSEQLQDATLGGSRRAVVAFSGTNSIGAQSVRLDPNVMVSASFTDKGFAPTVEAWGWDGARSRYNYYRLDGQPLRWKFRGSSVDADTLTAKDRADTCLACHINGGPVMRELPIPWNNWVSDRNPVSHLSATGRGHWLIAESSRFGDLKGAEDLEVSFILPAIRQFNVRRLNNLIRRSPAGQPVVTAGLQEIVDGPRALRSLFDTTEYNIASSQQLSGLHPALEPASRPPGPVDVPDAFFVDANLLTGGGPTQYAGLGIPEARQFGSLLRLEPVEYRTVVERFKTVLGNRQGDTNFAWFAPAASHIDSHMIDLLIRRGVISQEFAAAVLATDVETPVLSKVRPLLLSFIPATFKFRPRDVDSVPAAHPDELTKAVIASLSKVKPAPGTPQADFLEMLKSRNPRATLRQRVRDYFERVRTKLGNPADRAAEIDRLYRAMLQRRFDAAAKIPALSDALLFPTGSIE